MQPYDPTTYNPLEAQEKLLAQLEQEELKNEVPLEADGETTPALDGGKTPEEQEAEIVEEIKKQLEVLGLPRTALDIWKERFGTILCYPYGDKEIYVFRMLKVKDMDIIRKTLASVKDMTEEFLILQAGVLYPPVDGAMVKELPAGLPSLMTQAIMRISGYIPVEMALRAVREL